jgi:hypothetical protein
MSKRFKKLSYTIYERKYHFVFCHKYRFRIFKDDVLEYTKQEIYGLCRQKRISLIIAAGNLYFSKYRKIVTTAQRAFFCQHRSIF